MDMVTRATESTEHSLESEFPVAKPKIHDGSSLHGVQGAVSEGRGQM